METEPQNTILSDHPHRDGNIFGAIRQAQKTAHIELLDFF